MDFVQTVLVALAFILILAWLTTAKPKGLPPGPAGLPLLGYPLLGKSLHITLTELAKKYGNVFTLPLIGGYGVVLSDWKSIKEALVLQSDTFSGRPASIVSDVVLKRTDIIFSDGVAWKERRRFTLQHLKEFAFHRKSIEGLVMVEVNKLLEWLEPLNGQKVDFGETFYFSFLNLMWAIISGKCFEPSDPEMETVVKAIDKIVDGITSNYLMNLIPFLRHLPGSGYREFCQAHKDLDDYVTKEIDEHLETYQEGHARDFIDVYLTEIKKHQREQSSDSLTAERAFQRKHLNAIIWDLFMAGTETGSTTQMWALLYMVTWPEIQNKVQEELDRVIGRVRLPTIQDRSMLPYTEATLWEIQRFATIAPTSALHCTRTSAQLFDYTIPKSTTIFENIWAVHHDPKLWGDPEVFRPERLLTADGKVNKPEYLIPFSVGGRMCLGEPLAKIEMFLFFACLFHRFSFSVVPGERPPSHDAVNRITLRPLPFSVMVKLR